jgi:DMSO/TMAO reductase YedYZ molybdopterin-dependent catalytic subunit
MSDQTRRTFLVGAGVAAAAATAAAVVPGGAALAGDADSTSGPAGEANTDTLVAYVKDAKSGRISVLSGDREVVVTDRKLAQKLARLAD